MDQHGSSQPQSSPSATGNPVVAVGRKVKSIFSSHQRPSIRILRRPASHSTEKLQGGPVSTDFAEKPLPPLPPRENAPSASTEPTTLPESSRTRSRGNTIADRFANARSRAVSSVQSLFGHGSVTNDHGPPDQEYDTETVDLLDVVGTHDQPSFEAPKLTSRRPRSSNPFNTHQCSKFLIRSFPWEIHRPPACV